MRASTPDHTAGIQFMEADDFDIESAFATAQAAIRERSKEVDTEIDVKKIHGEKLAAWLNAQLESGMHVVPDSTHICTSECNIKMIDCTVTHPLFVCEETGTPHACGSMCNVPTSVHGSEIICSLTAIVLEAQMLSHGWEGDPEVVSARTDYRNSSKLARSAAAVVYEMEQIVSVCGKRDWVGIGTSSSANAMLCSSGDGWTTQRKSQKLILRKRGCRDPTIVATSSCMQSLASVVIMRLLASSARANVEERKMCTWTGDSRKALSRYSIAKKGQWRCLGRMINICYATMKKRVIDGVFMTSGEFKRIVDAYSSGFRMFIFTLCTFAGRDITEGVRITEEYVAAYLYMLGDGICHDGVIIVHRDLFMKAFLPEPSSIDAFGIDKSGYTSARNMIWKIIFKHVESTETPHDSVIEPIEV